MRPAGRRRFGGTGTHDEDRKHDAEKEGVGANDEGRVLALDDPGREGDAGAELLLAVRVAVQLVVAAADVVGEAAGARF